METQEKCEANLWNKKSENISNSSTENLPAYQTEHWPIRGVVSVTGSMSPTMEEKMVMALIPNINLIWGIKVIDTYFCQS